MKFSKKAKHLLIVVSLLFLVSFVIGKWCVLPILTKYPSVPLSARLGTMCSTVGTALTLYYQGLDGNVPENPVPCFVTYLMDVDPSFSREAPVEPYKSELDMSFYLLLPPKLESSNPLLIAYTGPFKKNREGFYRHALFLQGTKTLVLTFPEGLLKAVVGKETFEKKKPDFYIWKKRSKYLRDQSDKGK